MYSIYECISNELKRFEGKKLMPLESHHSSDKSSGATGDIVVREVSNNELYEVVEVKFNIVIDLIMIRDAYEKIKTSKLQRYYILSTFPPKEDELLEIDALIVEIKEEHGCQIIINGIMPTIKYYLRLLSNTDDFIENYTSNLVSTSELNYEHKVAWNSVVKINTKE